MKYLGVDFGTKSIGIAISNAEGTIAFPREEITNMRGAVDAIARVATDEGVGCIVVGDTRAMNDLPNTITSAAEKFIDLLSKKGIPIETVSEAWSSAEAMRFAPKGERHSNSAAAAIILQRFLDTKR